MIGLSQISSFFFLLEICEYARYELHKNGCEVTELMTIETHDVEFVDTLNQEVKN